VNPTPVPRRAFTICYMDGRTQSTLTGNHFPLMAGSLPGEPYPFVRELQKDCAALRETVAGAEEFVASLQEENRLLQESSRAAAAYARSLEEEMARLREMREETERYAKSLEADREQRNRPWPLRYLLRKS
jgi:hypothetical protein